MAIGMFIIIAIILIKFKPVYTVSIDGEKIGYIQNKSKFETEINKLLEENQEKNIAFVNIINIPKYEFKLLEKQVDTNEEEVILAIKDNSEITYYRYAINVDNKTIDHVNTMEEAENIVATVKAEIKDDINMDIIKTYTKDVQEISNIEISTVSTNIINRIKADKKAERKKQESTLNGIYLAVNPVSGNITSRFGSREAIRDHEHKGLDIATKTGTPIKSVADGTIIHSGTMGGYGNLIIIDHGNGVKTYYGHCSKLYVKKGETVKAGEIIAAVGSTGNSTGSHLHLEVRLNNNILNPLKYLYK